MRCPHHTYLGERCRPCEGVMLALFRDVQLALHNRSHQATQRRAAIVRDRLCIWAVNLRHRVFYEAVRDGRVKAGRLVA